MPYRVTRKWISRVEDGDRVRYEAGETFEPSDAELRAYGDRLEEVTQTPNAEKDEESDESESSGSGQTTPDTQEDELTDQAETAEADESETDDEEVDLEEMSYQDLQRLAGQYDDVSGRQTADELRDQLSEKV